MGDQHHRLPLGAQGVDGLEQRHLPGVVEVGVGLIEDDKGRVVVDRPGQADALALAAGELMATGAKPGVVALRQA